MSIINFTVSVTGIALIKLILQKVPRNGGKRIEFHIAYIILSCLSLILVPEFVQDAIFSPIGILVVGTVIPMYQSVGVLCSANDADDVEWLQFWLASGAFTFLTEWIDLIAEHFPVVADFWYHLEFCVLLWLLLPFTDGSAVLHNMVIDPLLSPLADQVMKKVDEAKLVIAMLALVNVAYIWVIWFAFVTLPEEGRRFIAIAVGTVYPLASSALACAAYTKTDYKAGRECTFWLTYWVCFSLLFLLMDYLEHFVGSIRGFYSVCLCGMVYLFLPMFKGADKVFRNVLVPLSGNYEDLLMRDITLLKNKLKRKLPPQNHCGALAKAAKIFTDETKPIDTKQKSL